MADQKAAPLRFPVSDVQAFTEAALRKSEVDASAAASVAQGLCAASLRGVDSHGVRLLPHYLKAVKGGRINPRAHIRFEKTGAATGRLDADHGFGHAAGIQAMHRAMELAKDAGAGHVAVRNSSHCGSMAFFALEACRQDMIGKAYTHATPKMRSANATRKFFGTNPICVAAPMADEAPFCYDGATTLVSVNKIRMHGEMGKTIPLGWAADVDGIDTTVPADADQLLPIGDYKGFGLAMMVDMYCGLLAGMPGGDHVSDMFQDPMSKHRRLGQFYSAIRIDAFEEADTFKAQLQETADRIRSQPRQDPAVPVMIPGDPEKRFQADREVHGIPVHDAVLSQFDLIARELKIEPLSR